MMKQLNYHIQIHQKNYLNQYDYSESNAHFMNIYYNDLSFKIIIDIMKL